MRRFHKATASEDEILGDKCRKDNSEKHEDIENSDFTELKERLVEISKNS